MLKAKRPDVTRPTLSLLLLLLAAPFATDFAADPVIGDKGFVLGLNGHALTQPVDTDISLDEQIALLKKAHAVIYRTPLPAKPNWERFSHLVDVLAQNQIALLPVLLPHLDYKTATPDTVEKEAHDYALACAQHGLGRVGYWELGNELDTFALHKKGDSLPDGKVYTYNYFPSGWSRGDFDDHRYQFVLATLRGMNRGIREGDPAAKTIVNTAGWVHAGFIQRLLDDHLDFDIIGWHWYSEDGDFHRAGGMPLLDRLTAFHKPIWITEGNYRAGKKPPAEQEPKQAAYLQQTLPAFGELYPVVQVYCVYTLFDETFEAPYGVVHVEQTAGKKWTAGTPKAAFGVICNYEND